MKREDAEIMARSAASRYRSDVDVEALIDALENLDDFDRALSAVNSLLLEGETPTAEAVQHRYGHAAPRDDLHEHDEHGLVWIHVWAWCRGWTTPAREPLLHSWFPQQGWHGDGKRPILTEAEYDELRAAWERVGAPRCSIRELPGMAVWA